MLNSDRQELSNIKSSITSIHAEISDLERTNGTINKDGTVTNNTSIIQQKRADFVEVKKTR